MQVTSFNLAIVAFFMGTALSAPTPLTIDSRYGALLCPNYVPTSPDAVCGSAVFAHCPCATYKPVAEITATLPHFNKRAPAPTDVAVVNDKIACPLYIGGPPCLNPALAHCPCATGVIAKATPTNPFALGGEKIVATSAANGTVKATATATAPTTLITATSLPALVIPTQAARLANVGTESVVAPAATAAPVRGVSHGASTAVAAPGSQMTMVIIEKK